MLGLFLFKIGIINIDFGTVLSFLVGVVMGFIILLLIYALAVISSLRSKDFIAKTEHDDLTTIEVKDMVAKTQYAYKDKSLRGANSRVPYCYHLSRDLAYAIAVRYYPKSKHPFLELSINELTMLTNYITSRVDEILNRRGIRMLRKLKISTIVNITTKKKEIEESKVYQTSKSIGQNLSRFKYVFNIINPLNWGRKLIVDRVLNLIIDKICLVVIAIVGEETYKIYSKKVFNKEPEIDTGTDQLIEEMSNSIKDAAKEIDSEDVEEKPVTTMRLKSKMLDFGTMTIPSTYSLNFALKKVSEE